MRRPFAICAATLLILGGCATPPPVATSDIRGDYGPAERYLSWMIDREMRQEEITGLSIALVDDQRVIWQQGFGYADLAEKIPATPDTIYRAGSIAKVFTAAAAMQLAEAGKIDIDQPLSKALPGFSIQNRFADSAPITPRNIMSHHSGLPSNFLKGLFVRQPDRFDTVVEGIRNEYQAFPANYVFSYSNLGMALLGAAVQEVSGEAFDIHMTKRFFEPLGMTQSSFQSRPIAKAYDRHKETEVFSLRDMPAANLLSNVVDLSQFLKMQFAEGRVGDQAILQPASIKEMVRVQNKGFPMTFQQFVGLGWMMSGIDVPGGGPVASHGGSLPDSHSMMAILPDHKLGVVILSNSATSHVSVTRIASEALRLMLAAKTGIRENDPKVVRAAERAPTAEELQAFNGNFDTLVGFAKVTTKAGQIDAEAVGHQFRLVPLEDNSLTIQYKLLGMMAVRVGAFEDIRLSMANVDGRQLIIGRIGGEALIFGEKLKPTNIPERFRQNLGNYEIMGKIDGPTPDRLLMKEEYGQLIGEAHFPEVPDLLLRIAFTPVSDNEVVTAGLGTGRGDTLRIVGDGNDAILEFSGLKMRKKLN